MAHIIDFRHACSTDSGRKKPGASILMQPNRIDKVIKEGNTCGKVTTILPLYSRHMPALVGGAPTSQLPPIPPPGDWSPPASAPGQSHAQPQRPWPATASRYSRTAPHHRPSDTTHSDNAWHRHVPAGPPD